MNKSTTERLSEYMIFRGINNNMITVSAGLSVGQIGKAISNNSGINSTSIEKILHTYPEISPEWLLTGKGSMLKTETEIVQPKIEVTSEIRLIPFYDGVMTASIVTQELPSQTEPVEMVNAGDWFRDATVAMRVHGDSMHPDYVSGSIIGMKEVFNKRLIIYGQDYMIETSEYRVIKRLQKSHNPECWLMCSTNTEIWEVGAQKGKLIHEPQDIYIDDVLRVYQILGSVKRNHSSRVVSII
jgi:hypothetical protein